MDAYTDAELREELARRERQDAAERWTAANKHYGPCPECGAELREIDNKVVDEYWEAPGWQGWPVPPPIDWHGRQRIGAEWEIRLTCVNDHARYERDVRFDKVAATREP